MSLQLNILPVAGSLLVVQTHFSVFWGCNEWMIPKRNTVGARRAGLIWEYGAQLAVQNPRHESSKPEGTSELQERTRRGCLGRLGSSEDIKVSGKTKGKHELSSACQTKWCLNSSLGSRDPVSDRSGSSVVCDFWNFRSHPWAAESRVRLLCPHWQWTGLHGRGSAWIVCSAPASALLLLCPILPLFLGSSGRSIPGHRPLASSHVPRSN